MLRPLLAAAVRQTLPCASNSTNPARAIRPIQRELNEAPEQQAATSEVLRVISNSPGELELVFQAMLERATRACGANFGVLFRYEGGLFHPAASLDVPPAFADFLVVSRLVDNSATAIKHGS